jgi:DNA helicase-2/ATP-dependent DNA helicase PcrA
LIGGAGTGKTTRLLDLMSKTIEAGGIEAHEIGFCSFTRAARSEASTRAAEQFDVKSAELEQGGWFRTLHSVAYKCLGIGKELLSGCKADRDWLAEVLQEEVHQDNPDSPFADGCAPNSADQALFLWQAARNRLEPLANIWSRAEQCSNSIPPLSYCEEIVRRYENAKILHHRLDFVDMLGRYAGWKFRVEGSHRVDPDGYVPALPVWFFDEQQDTSALLDSVCHRLMQPARWVYVVGDPFQAIYGWAGADPKLFQNWNAVKKEVMPKSYRCPRDILQLGEDLLRDCSDYWDRKIEPADREGAIETATFNGNLFSQIDPRGDWLLLARSNWHARRMATILDAKNIPWRPTKGRGTWDAPVKNAGLTALLNLQKGGPIDGEEWRQILKLLPSKDDGARLLETGTKKKFEDDAYQAADLHPWVLLSDLGELGATPGLIEKVRNGSWVQLVEGADRFTDAITQWGEEAVTKPGVRVGTIHSAKGAEADDVLWLTTTSEPVHLSEQTQEGFDEERRVAYVAATRARRRLIVAKERCRFNSKVPV